MNADAKKAVLRMIPYGIYVLTADDGAGNIAAATVNWVTQTAFAPPLVVAAVKTDSGAYKVVKAAQAFALNMLGKEHKGVAFTFFKPTSVSDGKLSGQAYRRGTTGAPLLNDAPGAVECRVVTIVEQGDHHIVVGEVVEAHLKAPLSGPARCRDPGDEGPWRQRVLRRLAFKSSLPGLIRQSMQRRGRMDARVKPAHDEQAFYF